MIDAEGEGIVEAQEDIVELEGGGHGSGQPLYIIDRRGTWAGCGAIRSFGRHPTLRDHICQDIDPGVSRGGPKGRCRGSSDKALSGKFVSDQLIIVVPSDDQAHEI